MNYKELIDLSKKAATEWQGTHEYYQAATLITALCEATETLLAERETAGWISVKDKPVPEEDIRYIVFAHYHKKHEVECTKGWAVGTNVTHWMPLPKPPDGYQAEN